MNDFLAPPDLRFLGRRATAGALPASGFDLKNLVTEKVPHEAMVWADRTLYFFDRNDDTSAETLAGTDAICIEPNSGPGRWKACGGRGLEKLNYNVTGSSFGGPIVVTGAGEWSIMPTGTWIPSSGRTPCLQVDTEGRITYNGPEMNFNVRGLLSVNNAVGATNVAIELGFSVNGSDIGTTNSDPSGGLLDTGANQQDHQLGSENYVTLSQGDIIGMKFRSSNGNDFNLSRAKFVLRPTAFQPFV